MVDSKENYKFDLAVKGLNSDGDDWSMGSCLRVAALFPQGVISPPFHLWGVGEVRLHVSYRR